MGRMVQCSLHDRDYKAPCDPPETNETRECLYCLTEIDLCLWGTHIQGKYHKVNKIINNWLKCFCWYKNREIANHYWGSCKECFRRLDESSNEDDPRFHEENEYNPEHDIEAKQAIALLQSQTNYYALYVMLRVVLRNFTKSTSVVVNIDLIFPKKWRC